jgi:predicted nucleotide-binding protein (sugar kinase/HSP70/actin superfamily)
VEQSSPGSKTKTLKTIGIPLTLYMKEYQSLFSQFFSSLNMKVIWEKSNAPVLQEGNKLINSDFCAPMILTHGLIKRLEERELDYIFLPTMINEQGYIKKAEKEEKFIDKINDSYFCYYSQYAGTLVNNLPNLNIQEKLLSPKIKLNNRALELVADELGTYLEEKLQITSSEIANAFIEAQNEFLKQKDQWKKAGQETISNNKSKIKILLLGRPYAIFDSQINLGIPYQLEKLGFDLIYQSQLDLNYEKEDDSINHFDRMHWYYGQQIMLASEKATQDDTMYPVFLTCFRCSPDSYLISYFKEMMNEAKKPYLVIQLDDHSSDVGYQTRIEAGVETFLNDFKEKRSHNIAISRRSYNSNAIEEGDTVLIPYLSPIVSRMYEMSFEAAGYKAAVLPLEQKSINQGYRYASGGECMPNVAIAGSLIDYINENKLDPSTTILFMPTICLACNFNQYLVFLDLACENAGIKGLKFVNNNGVRSLKNVPKSLNTNLHASNILSSILYKLYYRFHPYEEITGSCDTVLEESLQILFEAMKREESLLEVAEVIREKFASIKQQGPRRPRVAIVGDLYAKYNKVLNDDIYGLIEEQGGEVVIPAFTEITTHMLEADIHENQQPDRLLRGIKGIEERYEAIFKDLLEDSLEPPLDECNELAQQFGLEHFIAGEAAMNLGRILYLIKHKLVSAVVNVNPVFCCPGVISASIFRKIQKEFGVPIINLFYDGTNKPNKQIIPHLFYLKEQQEMVKE